MNAESQGTKAPIRRLSDLEALRHARAKETS